MKSRALARVQKPAPVSPPVPTHAVPDVLVSWLDRRSQNTRKAYTRDFADFARFMGMTDKDAANALLDNGPGAANHVVLSYARDMERRELKSGTIARRLSALRSLVKRARLIGRVTWSIDVESPKVETYRDTRGPGHPGYVVMLSARQAAADAGDIAAKRDVAILRLAHDLCLRRGSIAALELDDVDLDSEPAKISVVVKGKADKRVFTLPGPVRKRLVDWLEARPPGPGPVFVRLDRAAGDESRPMDGESLNRVVRRAGVKAGVTRGNRAHGLRHAGVTRLLELNNGNIPKAQALTGHAKSETLQRYNDNRLDAAGESSRLLAEDFD
jgi:integrase/recombinase XerC